MTNAEIKARDRRIHMTMNRCLSSWSLRNKKTLYSQLAEIGYRPADMLALYPSDRPVTVGEIKEQFLTWFTTLENYLNPPAVPKEEPAKPTEQGKTTDLVICDNKPLPLDDKAPDPVKNITPVSVPKILEQLPPEEMRDSRIKLIDFQERAAFQLVDNLFTQQHNAAMLRAPVGTGKTFIVARVIKYMIANRHVIPDNYGIYPIIYITKKTVVEQTIRVLEAFGIDTKHDVLVTHIEALRTQEFSWMIKREVIIKFGQEEEKITVRSTTPGVFLVDECQGLKNEDSLQSRTFQQINNVTNRVIKFLYFSATPFMNVAECKCFAVATRLPVRFGAGIMPLTNEIWPAFAKEISAPSAPTDFCTAAVKRLMQQLKPYIVDVKGVRSQFNARNQVKLYDFIYPEQRQRYDAAWNTYLKRKAKLDKMVAVPGGRFLILAQFTIFRRAAEAEHAINIAPLMVESEKNGFAPVFGGSFKQTICKFVEILITKYGYSRNDISIIWGGGQSGPSKKQAVKAKFMAKKDLLDAAGITLDELGLDDVDDYVEASYPEEWRLGVQSPEERQREIDKFQSGRTKFCFFTYKAGGVGLSLHHCDEQTSYKVKRKPSGWYVEEDIPNCPTRPRVTFLSPPLSAVEIVQGAGRVPRITSMSDTPQYFCCFIGTIEMRVAAILAAKLKCLRHVTRSKESWEDMIIGGAGEDVESGNNEEPKLIDVKATPVEGDDDSDEGGMFISEDDSDSDDED